MCVCESVCTSWDVVNTVSWKVLDLFSTNFQHWCILGWGWKPQFVGSKGQSSRSRWGPTWWKMCFRPCYHDILKMTGRNFTKLWLLVYLRSKMNCSDFEGRGIKFKVLARSDVKNLGPHIWGHGCCQGQGHFWSNVEGVIAVGESIRIDASTSKYHLILADKPSWFPFRFWVLKHTKCKSLACSFKIQIFVDF